MTTIYQSCGMSGYPPDNTVKAEDVPKRLTKLRTFRRASVCPVCRQILSVTKDGLYPRHGNTRQVQTR